MISEVTKVRALESAFVEDLATGRYFLVLHEIGQFPKNIR